MKNCRRQDLLKAKKCFLEAIEYRNKERLRVNIKNTSNKKKKRQKNKKTIRHCQSIKYLEGKILECEYTRPIDNYLIHNYTNL